MLRPPTESSASVAATRGALLQLPASAKHQHIWRWTMFWASLSTQEVMRISWTVICITNNKSTKIHRKIWLKPWWNNAQNHLNRRISIGLCLLRNVSVGVSASLHAASCALAPDLNRGYFRSCPERWRGSARPSSADDLQAPDRVEARLPAIRSSLGSCRVSRFAELLRLFVWPETRTPYPVIKFSTAHVAKKAFWCQRAAFLHALHFRSPPS